MRQRLNRGRVSTRRTFTVALILFAMLCGLTLVVAPNSSSVDPARVKRAINNIDKASHALEATNYGETRQHLQQARKALSRSINQQ